ncbi:MAG: TSUP family transporter [Chloroflexi bacterium]|nr:TSUP family transporter [Chloroflexota bacterium]
MDYLIVILTALLVSAIALYSGFGLGTLLLPAFALFFPIPVAVAATAVVHLANNLFKLGLVGRNADRKVTLLFGLPGIAAAILGALLLVRVSAIPPLAVYTFGGQEFSITVVKSAIAVLIAGFAILELSPVLSNWKVQTKYLPVGGLLSGFFGGLSGQQGALRAPFLAVAGLDARGFVGTTAVVAIMVDLARLAVYGPTIFGKNLHIVFGPQGYGLVIAAAVSAFLGTYLGSRYLKKVTMRTIRMIVGVLLVVVAVALAAGVA